ncbi:hypothetical protein INT46_003481 [Mucor plumbeus]|uniref:Transposase Tc1-like domain-containing protein n=1 Tax=Mucor plumbeus TaxID=97098 RepID=A0A8H7R668_9FUNG|nr:hypothetical protein INT46_003481 [Mucor plumbeus]
MKPLLLRNTLLCSIKKMYPTFDMANLSKYRREFLEGAQASTGGRSSKYIARMVRNGSLDGLRGAQEYLRSTNISMLFSGAEKLHNGMGFKAKRKNKTNFVSAANKKLRLAWARKHRQLTVSSDWRKWVFSGKTRVNIGGSDSESFYWSDVPGTNRPHKSMTRNFLTKPPPQNPTWSTDIGEIRSSNVTNHISNNDIPSLDNKSSGQSLSPVTKKYIVERTRYQREIAKTRK